MTNHFRLALGVGFFLLILPQAASAYVDPGTTGSVFGMFAAIVSGAGVILAFLARPIHRLFRRRGKKGVSVNESGDASHKPPTA